MTAFLFSIIAALAAFGGGILALKGRKNLNATLGFTAGVILGLVAFDLLPEIFNITQSTGLDPTWPMITLVKISRGGLATC
jgi:zinc transporter ZupT